MNAATNNNDDGSIDDATGKKARFDASAQALSASVSPMKVATDLMY